MEIAVLFPLIVYVQIAVHSADWLEPPTLDHHPTLVQMLKENNRLRASVGLPPQKMSRELTEAAQDHAWFMAETGQFSHSSNGGFVNRAARHGYQGSLWENIAMGQTTIPEVFQSWRASSGHWANITSQANIAGFGFAISKDGTCYWVGMYGEQGGEAVSQSNSAGK